MSRLLRPIPLGGGALGALGGFATGEIVGVVVGLVAGAGLGLAADRRQGVPRPPRIDPFTLGEPWRRSVQEALKARARFGEIEADAPDGAIRERLRSIGERVDEAVETSWRVARQGQSIADARRRIDVRSVEAQLDTLESTIESTVERDHADSTGEALRVQLDTARRLDGVVDDTHASLRLLNARLGAAVARALELATRGDGSALEPVSTDVEDVALELEALRLALDETDAIGDDPDAPT